MDLEAANMSDVRGSRLTRLGILSCFILASAVLVATLAFAGGIKEPQNIQNTNIPKTAAPASP